MRKSAKLTEEQLMSMRQLYIDGHSLSWLAANFNVSTVTVNNRSKERVGKTGKTWKELRDVKVENEKDIALKVIMLEEIEDAEEVVAKKADQNLSQNEKGRRKWLRKTIREVDQKLKMPKLKPSEYIALSKYRLELQNELTGRDETIIIGAPKEFPDKL